MLKCLEVRLPIDITRRQFLISFPEKKWVVRTPLEHVPDPTHAAALFEGPLTFETVYKNIPTIRQEDDDILEVSNTRNIVIQNEVLNLNCIMQRRQSQTMSMKPPQ